MTPADAANARDEIAARWAVRVDAGALSPEEQAELDAWTGADIRQAGAFARAMAGNAYLDRAVALGAHRAPVEAEPMRRIAISRRTWLAGAGSALAASLVAAVGLGWWRGGERIEAGRGTIRRASLHDGSAVTLNSGAEIEVALQQQLRSVRLLTGEANFDVARDALRPFVVDVGAVRIRVVGTSFLVRRLPEDGVSVTVREGIVEVAAGGEAPLRLTAGDRTILRPGASPELARLSGTDVERLGLWQSGQIDLTGMTLGDAASEFARYSDQHIVIRDPAVARMKVAGIYSVSDPAGFANAAAESMDLAVSRTPDAITLSRK